MEDPTQTDLSSCDWLWLTWLKNSAVCWHWGWLSAGARCVTKTRPGFSSTLSLESALLQIGFNFNHMLFLCHWRADPTPDHTLSQIQVPAERVRFCFPKVLAKALLFFQWALTESCDHIWICHPRQLIRYTYWFYSEHWEGLRRGLEVHDSRMGKVQYTKNYDQDWAKMMSEAVSTEITKVLPFIHRGYVLRPPLDAWNLR